MDLVLNILGINLFYAHYQVDSIHVVILIVNLSYTVITFIAVFTKHTQLKSIIMHLFSNFKLQIKKNINHNKAAH